MQAYIKSASAISPQETFNDELFSGAEALYEGTYLKCREPEYKEIINPGLIRRMSRIVKMGVATAIKSLKDAGIEQPDAIITGTGLGCMEDTGNFLKSIIENKEQFLTPTAFIQSTHNTISGQIALMLKCNNYNFAYVHRGFSFESALLDALMMLHQKDAESILLGGIDEITEDYLNLTKRLKLWKNDMPGKDLWGNQEAATIAGEGASFFVLSNDSTNAYASFKNVEMVFQPENTDVIIRRMEQMLEASGLQLEGIDAVMLGMNGWPEQDAIYHQLCSSVFKGKTLLTFKNLCGEYMTASAFGAWLASGIIRHGKIPGAALLEGDADLKPKNILVYNHFMKVNHTLMLISAC